MLIILKDSIRYIDGVEKEGRRRLAKGYCSCSFSASEVMDEAIGAQLQKC